MKFLRAIHAATQRLLDVIQRVISSPFWAFGTIFITLSWMGYERFISRHPAEGGFNGWAYTVVVYTLITVWLDNFIKVQQSQMNKMQQHQMDRMEFILRYLRQQSENMNAMLEENGKRDVVIHNLVTVSNSLAQQLYESLNQKEVK